MKDALEQLPVRTPTGPRELIARFLARRRTVLVILAALLLVLAIARMRRGGDAGSAEASLAAALADDGLLVDARSVVFFGEGGVLSARPALFRARDGEGGAHDVYYADARPGRDGALLDVAWATNLTRTSGADEADLTRLGDHLLYTSRVQGQVDAVTILDLGGESDALTAAWPLRARAQNRISNLQETGRSAGVGRVRYRFVEPVASVEIRERDGAFVVVAGDRTLVIDPEQEAPVEGGELVEASPQVKGMPGTITWVVDTVRNLSFVGPAPIEWLEHTVFGVKDSLERAYHGIIGTDTEAEAAEVAADLGTAGMSDAERRRRLSLSVTDPELGWPPASAEAVLSRRVAGEGEWMAVVDDAFVNSFPNAPPAFVQTFLRADPERAYTRVYITMWDPRQVQLHIVSGTREPESATGETGRGMAPRDETTMRYLVGGFNGGFQALHGEFGMMAEGRVYLPPKPWAATVGVYEDGRVAMGSWSAPPSGIRGYEERWAVEQIPEGMIAYRQNLTSVVEDGQYNPFERWWWGAAPANSDEQTYIDRTGLCLTEEGFLAYFWGKSMGPVALGNAMLATRCVRGMHLDMNSRHTGFEFYDVARVTEGFAALDRELDEESEFEGPMPFSDDFLLRARKGVRAMTPMRFPRYSGRDGRDFFYLTLRPTLPGAHLEAVDGESAGAGEFSATGLPHAGWPHAFARAFVGGDEGSRSWLVRVDASRVTTEADGDDILAYLVGAPEPPSSAGSGLYTVGGRLGAGVPPTGATLLIAGTDLERTPGADVAVGVDRDGFLVYAERQADDTSTLLARLARAGVDEPVALPSSVRLAFELEGQTMAPDGYERPVEVTEGTAAIALRAVTTPRTEVLFPDTEPLPYSRWRRLQDARVRYFREAPPTFTQEGGGLRDNPPPEDGGAEAP